MLKDHLKPWLDEAYEIMNTIEGKLASMQDTHQKLETTSRGSLTKQLVKELKQVATQCTTEVANIQVKLGGLRCKISAPAE